MRCIDREQFNVEGRVKHGRSRTILSCKGNSIKQRSVVYLIYQRLARKVADDDLHEDEDD